MGDVRGRRGRGKGWGPASRVNRMTAAARRNGASLSSRIGGEAPQAIAGRHP